MWANDTIMSKNEWQYTVIYALARCLHWMILATVSSQVDPRARKNPGALE